MRLQIATASIIAAWLCACGGGDTQIQCHSETAQPHLTSIQTPNIFLTAIGCPDRYPVAVSGDCGCNVGAELDGYKLADSTSKIEQAGSIPYIGLWQCEWTIPAGADTTKFTPTLTVCCASETSGK